MDERVQFASSGLRLSGILDARAGTKTKAAFIVLHGFGSNKDAGNVTTMARFLSSLGYVTLRFDMRGCGESAGPRGRTICLEQVEDARSALSFLSEVPAVDPKRIAIIGNSFGAAVAVYAAGVDARFACCISSGGWGDGAKKFRKQHESPQAWQRFTQMLERGREMAKRGEILMVPRYDIVPIRPELRHHVAPGSILEFPFDVVESMYGFRANDVVGRIAPRPLLLLHPAADTVTPTEQSVDLFLRAGQPTDLHLIAGVDHFMFAEGNTRVLNLVREWLAQRFPA